VTIVSIAPITHSAIASSKTPRPFVTSTSLSTSAGNSSPSTPSLADWIHRSFVASGHAASSSGFEPWWKKRTSASSSARHNAEASGANRMSAIVPAASIPGR
jgi:hypothetical protein